MQFRFSFLGRMALLVILAVCRSGLAQTASGNDSPPTLKQFGASLKRLKWDPDKKAAVETTSRENLPKSSPGEEVVRVDIDLVVCEVLVLDREGNIVPGLAQNDFIVTEDNKPQEVAHFSAADDLSIERSIVLIIDYSSSQLPFIRTSIEAANILVDQLRPRDRMAIVTDDVKLMVDYTRDKLKLKSALEELRQRATLQDRFGRSDNFSALMATARELFSQEDYRRIVIFQTDGDELELLQPPDLYRYYFIPTPPANASEKERRLARAALAASVEVGKPVVKNFSLNDVYSAVEKSRSTVYSVIPGVRLLGLSPAAQLEGARRSIDYWLAVHPTSIDYKRQPRKYQLRFEEGFMKNTPIWLERQSAVDRAARVTGGFTSYLENPALAEEIYSRILSDMNSRYLVAYYPSNKLRDGRRRSVVIEVRNHPEYRVEGRKSYYAAGPEQ